MIKFECDYLEGAHPNILQRLVETNMEQTSGYGFDKFCDSAKERIKKACNNEYLGIYFLSGGTQTNLSVISSLLRPHQGAITPITGHINVHETGAIEATGHKVRTGESEDGKITPEQIEKTMELYINDEAITHLVQPGLVYISQPTETGTMYSKSELEAIYRMCQKYGLFLFVDGARLGYSLASEHNDVSLEDLASLCDVFYIGGTKCGALFGEAVVFTNQAAEADFIYVMKQKGGLLAKGRILGIQFDELFKDNLYVEICRGAVKDALRIKKACMDKGWKMLFDSYTNQQYPIIPDEKLEILGKDFSFSYFTRIDDKNSAVRFCTSWATKKENVDKLIETIESI